MTIGVVIPTRGDRATFLNQAKYLLANQTLQPQHIEVVDHPAAEDEIDTAKRYKIGFERLFAKGCDVVICWEDDDWYSPIYIEVMVNKWLMFGKPDLFGIGNTVYYHVTSLRYLEMAHPKKASMFSTVVTKKVLELDLDKSNQYLDDFLWVQSRGKVTAFTYLIPKGNKPICLGIKHGSTIVAGGAHEPDSRYYNKHDHNRDLLRSITGSDFAFYSKSLFAFEYSKRKKQLNGHLSDIVGHCRTNDGHARTSLDIDRTLNASFLKENSNSNKNSKENKKLSPFLNKSPFLTIITRCFKRPIGLSENQKSLEFLRDQDFEQIFITDNDGVGLLEANKSFGNVTDIIEGEYVFLLDDDDFITNPDMIEELKRISDIHDPDVIFFRMTIKNNQNGNYYPTTELCWGKKPIIARIGGSCFVVKKKIYKNFIHHFAKARCGDFYFIEAVFNSGAKCYWLDLKMCETGKVSRGKPEIQ